MSKKSKVLGYSGIALYPTAAQKLQLNKVFGCVRYVYNSMINAREWEYHKGITHFLDKEETPIPGKKYRRTMYEWRKILTTESKLQYPWLKEAPSVALQQAVSLADKNYWDMVKNRSQGKKASLPRKRKYGNQSFELTRTSFSIEITDSKRNRGYINISKVGKIRFHAGKDISQASSMIVKLDKTGKYVAAARLPKVESQHNDFSSEAIALDLGLSQYLVSATTDGEISFIDNPRFYRKGQRRIARASREFSRKKKGGSNRKKSRIKLARENKKVSNQRMDFLHKLSTLIADNNHAVIMEDLNVAGMSKNKKLSKSIYDAGWGKFISMISYKQMMRNGEIVVIDRFYPSSQICCVCGNRDGKKELSIRKWICPHCESFLERDINAAINLLDAGGYSESLNACGEDIRRILSDPQTLMKQEKPSEKVDEEKGNNPFLMTHPD